jgi:aminoglycoside 6'-N-acetyltransferase I
MAFEVRVLKAGEAHVLSRVADEVFDNAIDQTLTEEFLADPRHHIAVAIENGVVVGFASGVDYVHPDKPRELFINEVGVSPQHRRRGVGTAVLQALLDVGRARGCKQAWVLTSPDNEAAVALYGAAGGGVMDGEILGFEFGQE